jgi:hypothetical protein
MLFLDPHKPIATCIAESCDGCTVIRTLHCHFRPKDLIHFLCLSAPAFLLGGAGIYHVSGLWLALWVVMIIGYFGFLEIRVMCSHCPHYAEPGHSLKCWANYGAPKLWKYRPGPMSLLEKVLFLVGLVVVGVYPLIFFFMGNQWFLLIVYLVSVVGFCLTVKIFLCSQCMNFACPLNTVDDQVKLAFLRRNPEVAKAWDVAVE